MSSRLRAVVFLAGLLLVFLVTLLALSTRWTKAWVFEQATATLRSRYGLEIHAATFDYRLRSLSFSADEVEVALVGASDRPIARIARLEIDLAGSALRGRPDFDAVLLRDARIVIDSTTRPPAREAAAPSTAPRPGLPAFLARTLQLDGVDLTIGDSGGTRLVVSDLSGRLDGREGGRELTGTLAAAGGVALSFGAAAIDLAFDRADAHVALDGTGVTGSLTAASPVATIRAEGHLPTARDAPLDVRFEGDAVLEQLDRWWAEAPDATGRVHLAGRVTGPLTSPEASFRLAGRDLGWSAIHPATVEGLGRVSSRGLEIEAFSLASHAAALDGRGTVAFDADDRSEVTGRWHDVGADLVARLIGQSLNAVSRTALAGSATLAWNGARPRLATLAGRIETTAAAAAPDGSARGTLHAEGRDGRWRIRYQQALDGSVEAALVADVTASGEHIAGAGLDGSVELRAGRVELMLAQLRRLGLSIPDALATAASTTAAFDGSLTGTLGAPRLEGTLSAEGVRAASLDDVSLDGTVAVDRAALAVSPVQIRSGRNHATLTGKLPWSGDSGQGTIAARVEEPERLVPSLPAAWTPSGTIDLTGGWTGSVRQLGVSMQLSATELAVNGIAFESLSASGSFAQGRITLDEVKATQPRGAVTGSGWWTLVDSTMSAQFTGTNLTLAILSPGDSGVLDRRARLEDASFEARITGPGRRPDGLLTVSAGSAELDGRDVGTLSMHAEAAAGVVRITAEAPRLAATGTGQFQLETPWPFEGRLAFTGTDVGALTRLAGASDSITDSVSASIDATVEASGRAGDFAATDATVSVTRLDGAVRGERLATVQAGGLRLQDGHVSVHEPLGFTWGATSLALTQAPAQGPAAGVLMSLEGTLREITALVPEMLPEGVLAEGTVKAEVLLGDRLTDIQPTGQLTLTLAALTRDEQELARNTTLVADADATTIHVREVRGTVLGGPFEAHGSLPVAWVRAGEGRANPAPSEPATFWLKSGAVAGTVAGLLRDQPPRIDGSVNLVIEGSATAPRLDAIRATIRDESGGITVGGFALKAARPTELRLDQGLLYVDGFEWRGPQSTFTASGSVALSDGVEGGLKLRGDGSLALLTLLVPARVDGRTRFDLEVSGPPGQREVLGAIGIEDGSMVVQSWRLAMADWSGDVVLGRDHIDVKGLRGQFNGGEATVEGGFPVGAGTSATPSLAIAVRGAFLDLPKGLRSQIDTDLEWRHSGGGSRLSGHVVVTARAYREPATEIARIAAALIDRSRGAPLELPAAVAATALDVQLSTVGPLAIANSVARVELLPDLQLTGTASKPALRGQVAVADDGRIQFGGRQYRLRDSRVEFSPDRGLVPRLAVSGETRVADHTVFLRVSGTADQIETALSSDPPLGERDLQTLLVTGQRESLGRDSSSDQDAVGAMSGDVLGVAGQFLGFDAVTVSTTDDLALVSSDVDPALRLTVSKRIGQRFELVLSDNLEDNELTWVVIYRPRPGFEFRVLSRDNTEFTGEFRQEVQFGPGVSPPRTPTRRRVASDRVAAVTVSGDPGFATDDILSETSLGAGDEFDFSRWLEDRDRIARLFQERGYFAARIVPTRRPVASEAGQARVALDYRVIRGPRTELSVTGYAPGPDVEAQLRQAWADSVLVDLLQADLTRVMRDHLADAGYLRATIGVEVDRSRPDLIAATITVDPGPRTTERHLAFSGHTVLTEKELLAAAAARPGLTSPWRDPTPLLELLADEYAARGYLAMTASTGALAFTGSAATLPVLIVEGPVARVTSVTVSGANQVPQSEAVAASGLTVGTPYLAGGEQAARVALERYYRNLGYRDAAVDLQSRVNAGEGRVDVAVAVSEGARYVVRSVRTTGVQSTREATVERASHIEPGSPASPAVSDAARRRLYDIGTFRSAEVTFAPVEGGPTTGPAVPVDALVTVQESKRYLLLYGVEVTNQYQSLFDQRVTSGGVAADLRDRNFLGRGWTLGAGVRYEPSFRSARLLATVPRLGTRRIRTNVYADSSREERARTEDVLLIDDETTLSLEQRWRPRTPVELSWGYQFNRRNLRFQDAPTDRTIIDLEGDLASLAGAVVVDRRDNMFDAKRGWLSSLTTEWGLQPIGSDFNYLRTAVRASFYLPLGRVTLASNVRWGELLAFRGQPPISALDLFYTAGGTQTVRGYRQDSLSAYYLEVQGERVPLGGTKLLVFNEEVRFPLFWLLSGAAFVDAGNTFTDEKGIVLGDLAVGAGFGVRIRTPLAPVRLDLGFPVSSRTGQTGPRWHFSIGQIF